jgi:TfoX-like protein
VTFSKSLAQRIRDALGRQRCVVEKKMFGGLAFMLNGNLLVCVWKNSLIVRLGSVQGEKVLREPHVKEFDITGKPMRGWVMIEPEGIDEDAQLEGWIALAEEFVLTLPAK